MPVTPARRQRVDKVIDIAEQTCRAQGLRLTAVRRRALEAIARAGKPMKAYDILDQLAEKGARAYPVTAYRALEFLQSAGLVHRVEALNAYVLCTEGHHDAAASFYVCERCGDVREVPSEESPAATPAGFHVQRSVVEHYGECSDCHASKP